MPDTVFDQWELWRAISINTENQGSIPTPGVRNLVWGSGVGASSWEKGAVSTQNSTAPRPWEVNWGSVSLIQLKPQRLTEV